MKHSRVMVTALLAVAMSFVGTCAAVAEIVDGTSRPDKLHGTPRHDLIWGRGGDDRIWSYGGRDEISGGRGTDKIRSGAGPDVVGGGKGSDFILTGQGADWIISDPGIDGPDIFDRPGDGDDVVVSGPGNDYVSTFLGINEAHLGDGNDTFENRYFQSTDTVFLGPGSDSATAYFGKKTIYGGRGRDWVQAGGGDATIRFYGGRAADTYAGPVAGEVSLFGGAGPDLLFINSAMDKASYASGGKGDDRIQYSMSYTYFPETIPEIDCGPGVDSVKIYYVDSPPPSTPDHANCEQITLLPGN